MATLSTAARNAAVDAVASGAGFGRLRDSGATLLIATAAPAFAAASGGSAVGGLQVNTPALATGILSTGAFRDSGNTEDWITFTIGLPGSGAELEFTGVNVANGQRAQFQTGWVTLSIPAS